MTLRVLGMDTGRLMFHFSTSGGIPSTSRTLSNKQVLSSEIQGFLESADDRTDVQMTYLACCHLGV